MRDRETERQREKKALGLVKTECALLKTGCKKIRELRHNLFVMQRVSLSLWGGALTEASAVPWHPYLPDSLWSGGLAEAAAAVLAHTCQP